MKNELGVALMAALAAGVAQGAAPVSPLITQAKKLIASESIDPLSLQYRRVRIVRGSVQGKTVSVVCGEFNSKNRFGGHIGFAKFAYETTIMKGALSRTAEGKIEFYGDSASETDIEAKAHLLGLCLGG